MPHPDICIAGAGIIGLSLALELHQRGLQVTVVDKGHPLSEASSAAAGMLAAADPGNPALLRPLADLSLTLYPAFLDRLRTLSGIHTPFQTLATIQEYLQEPEPSPNILTESRIAQLLPGNTLGERSFYLLDEQSIDPRQLASALLSAVQSTSIRLLTRTSVLTVQSDGTAIAISTSTESIRAASFVDCTGAWSSSGTLPVAPIKGQMLAIALPPSLPMLVTLRTDSIYIVPRTQGASAGRAVIGATIEDAGFDKTVRPSDISKLLAQASDLLPQLASAPVLESWSGLRPATPDGLPILGSIPGQPNRLLATGHYRNGILLAPATAHVMAQLIFHETPSIDLAPFSPNRAATEPQPSGNRAATERQPKSP